MQNKFFGSKLNSILLLVLIILVAIAIGIMLKDKETYFPEFSEKQVGSEIQPTPEEDDNLNQNTESAQSGTYVYKNHGFTMGLPEGFVPREMKGETGPTISIELPNDSGWLVYVTDATWWEKYNLDGQADFIRNQEIGGTIFKVYKYTGQDHEFYWFRQGNVAYTFSGDAIKYMETFKFVGWN